MRVIESLKEAEKQAEQEEKKEPRVIERMRPVEEKHKKRIEEIMAEMDCPKDFQCHKNGFERLCKAKDAGMPGYVDCLEENALDCEFRVPFGVDAFCRCGVRVYIAKELKI